MRAIPHFQWQKAALFCWASRWRRRPSPTAIYNRSARPDPASRHRRALSIPGHVLAEVGLADWTLDKQAGTRSDTVVAGDLLLRYGFGDRDEFQIGLTSFGTVRERDANGVSHMSGVGDLKLALQAQPHPSRRQWLLGRVAVLPCPSHRWVCDRRGRLGRRGPCADGYDALRQGRARVHAGDRCCGQWHRQGRAIWR